MATLPPKSSASPAPVSPNGKDIKKDAKPTGPKTVRDIMTTKVYSAKRTSPVTELARLMVKFDLSGIPVVRKDAVVGIVTDGDLVAQKSNIHAPQFASVLHSFVMLRSSKSVEEEITKLLGSNAEDIMTSPVVSVKPTDTIAKLATTMVETKANPIPVLAEGKLVGIVSRHDLLKLMASEAATRAAATEPTPPSGSKSE